MSSMLPSVNRKRTQLVFLILSYLCMFCSVFDVVVRLGWLHARVPGLYGMSALLKWLLAAGVFLFFAWYVGRLSNGESTPTSR